MTLTHNVAQQRSGFFVRAWRAYGEQAHVCGTRACVALARARVCVQDMTCARVINIR